MIQIKAYHRHNIINVLMLRYFCNLSLFFIVFINIILLPNGISKQDNVSSIYNSPTIVYAQQQQSGLPANNSQEWVDKQSNTKVQFTYSPDKPLVSGFTKLKFNLEDSKKGTPLKDVFARVTIIGVLPQKAPLKFYNIKAPNGNFSVEYRFPLEGTYQIFVKADSKNSALALAPFEVFVPFRPVGTININNIYPILIPLGLVALVGTLAILSFMLFVNKMKKSQ
ncbi:MAG TPA: hypothetical protein VH500_14250 [Nitrososphaeraceae archaeon]|jgi:hypothetical protein